MPTYTFFLHSGEGIAASLEGFELGGDEFAGARALKMLAEHPSCSYLAVWDAERRPAVRRRFMGTAGAPGRVTTAPAPPIHRLADTADT